VPYDQLPRYLATADAFVTASVTEVHPLSVIEAQASGLPVLGIQSPGVGDIVEDGVTGLLAQEEDLALFTAKMIQLLMDREQLKKMSIQAREKALAYSYERTSQILLDLYQQQIDNNSRHERSTWQKISVFLDDLVK
jgi:1,2-diacylglycerol 3-alpha-glucosyltransferase